MLASAVKKNKSEKRDRVTEYPILDKKVREGLPEEVTYRQRPKQSEGEVHAAMREKNKAGGVTEGTKATRRESTWCASRIARCHVAREEGAKVELPKRHHTGAGGWSWTTGHNRKVKDKEKKILDQGIKASDSSIFSATDFLNDSGLLISPPQASVFLSIWWENWRWWLRTSQLCGLWTLLMHFRFHPGALKWTHGLQCTFVSGTTVWATHAPAFWSSRYRPLEVVEVLGISRQPNFGGP